MEPGPADDLSPRRPINGKMEYPREFSLQARARVDAEKLGATRQLRQDRNDAPWSRFGPSRKDEENLRNYVLRVFLVFAEQACELGAQGRWTVDRIRSVTDEFLRRFTIEAYSEEGHDKTGRKLREMVSHWDGHVLPEIRREFEGSAKWQQFEEALEAVAIQQARRTGESADRSSLTGGLQVAAEPKSGADLNSVGWDGVEISFLSDKRVQICHGPRRETLNYAEFGFADRRNGKPSQAWWTLRTLAEERGTLRDAAKTGRDWSKVEKYLQTIRQILRRHFGISGDPVPFVRGTGYRTRFKIGCGPSFHT
jgi:hypothetical protein